MISAYLLLTMVTQIHKISGNDYESKNGYHEDFEQIAHKNDNNTAGGGVKMNGKTISKPRIESRKVLKDTPLVEVVFRKYEMPYENDDRELLKKFCLSIGLLQPGDSRDVIVDILHALLIASKKKVLLDSEEIRENVIELRKKEGLPLLGIASSNIRRQIKRIRDLQIAEKIKNKYRITEFASMQETFEEKVENYILPSILSRIKEYFRVIDKRF